MLTGVLLFGMLRIFKTKIQRLVINFFKYFFALFITINLFGQNIIVEKNKPYLIREINKNEELFHIANDYGLSIEEIKSVNNLLTNKLDSISQLKIPIKVQGSRKQINEGNLVFYKVKDNEKLHTIADDFDISLSDIKQVNLFKKNKLLSGSYILLPNTFPAILHKNKLVIRGFLSLGFFSGTDWAGTASTNYHIRGQFNLQNIYEKKPFRMLSYVNTSIGYRHELGKYFLKNVDRFSLKQQLEIQIKNGFAFYVLGSIRSQHFDNFRYINDEKDLTTSFMAPGYVNYSAGLTYSNDYLLLDFGLYEMRSVYVLQDKVFKERSSAFGVPREDKFFGIHGFSLRADLDLYKSEKFNTNASFYGFYNKDVTTLDFRAELTYRMHKMLKLTLLNEIVYDNFDESTFHYRAEVLIGVSFIKY